MRLETGTNLSLGGFASLNGTIQGHFSLFRRLRIGEYGSSYIHSTLVVR
jgi:hypothetical protein